MEVQMEIRYLGHATFELSEGSSRVLIDPFLAPNNPKATVSADDVEPTHILLTHGHVDHIADAVAVAIGPIGGHYTMDRHDAVVAVKLVGAEVVIPCHYNTFPPIETDADAFKADVESQTSSKVVVLQPDQTHGVRAAAAA